MHTHHHRAAHQAAADQEYLNWYKRLHDPGTPFDPTELVELARTHCAPWPAVAEAIARCTRTWRRSDLYTAFTGPLDKRALRFRFSFFLDHPTLGTLTVDVFQTTEAPHTWVIGGFEHLDRVLGRRTSAAEMNELTLKARAFHAKQFASN